MARRCQGLGKRRRKDEGGRRRAEGGGMKAEGGGKRV